ncbi:MAG: acyl-CoA dehydrogenase family protein [Thalassotalea sp.]|nr:acyl-CoA dehydrogenase family protein [Thalassotalea sp.]MDG2392764.1 acyl-CoA dehydrogenase family protein [Thalassotalea sp.]
MTVPNKINITGINDDFLTPEAIRLIESAEKLVPSLLERASATDVAGKVPDETVKEMNDAGLFRVLQPKRWGGFELDPRVFYIIQMTLAQGCMSTAWIYGVIGVHNWQIGLFDEKAQIEVLGEDSATLIASTYMPVGKVEKVDGGYNFSGRWGFSSGVEHCKWIFLGGLVPKSPGSKELEHRTFLLPKSDYKIVKNWDVHGLRGTGSHDIVVEGAFVPDHRTHQTNDYSDEACKGRAINDNWLYKIPFVQIFQRAVSTACIGALDGAITEFRDRCAEHVGKHGGKTAEDVNAQMAVTEAIMTSDQLKLVLFRNFAEVVKHTKNGEMMPVNDRLLQRAQSAAVSKQAGERVNEILRACAGSGLYRSNPIERIFRDIHQSRGHIANNTDAYIRAHGTVMLGLPNADPFV